MATDVLQRKKRIAHIPKRSGEGLETSALYPGRTSNRDDAQSVKSSQRSSTGVLSHIQTRTFQYSGMSTIKKEMHNNLLSLFALKSGDHLPASSKIHPWNKTGINASPTPTTSSNVITAPKSKNIGNSCTFSLMEKCLKDFKQIKHNRNIPKPQSHLVALPDEINSSYFDETQPNFQNNTSGQMPLKAHVKDSCIEKSIHFHNEPFNDLHNDDSIDFDMEESSYLDKFVDLHRETFANFHNAESINMDKEEISDLDNNEFIDLDIKEATDLHIEESINLHNEEGIDLNNDNSLLDDHDSDNSKYEKFIESVKQDSLKNIIFAKKDRKHLKFDRSLKKVTKKRPSKTKFSSAFFKK